MQWSLPRPPDHLTGGLPSGTTTGVAKYGTYALQSVGVFERGKWDELAPLTITVNNPHHRARTWSSQQAEPTMDTTKGVVWDAAAVLPEPPASRS